MLFPRNYSDFHIISAAANKCNSWEVTGKTGFTENNKYNKYLPSLIDSIPSRQTIY